MKLSKYALKTFFAVFFILTVYISIISLINSKDAVQLDLPIILTIIISAAVYFIFRLLFIISNLFESGKFNLFNTIIVPYIINVVVRCFLPGGFLDAISYDYLFNMIFSFVICLFIYKTISLIWSEKYAWIAALTYAFWPGQQLIGTLWTGLVITLIVLAFYFMIKAHTDEIMKIRYMDIALSGVFLSVSIFFNRGMILFLPCFLIFLFTIINRQKNQIQVAENELGGKKAIISTVIWIVAVPVLITLIYMILYLFKAIPDQIQINNLLQGFGLNGLRSIQNNVEGLWGSQMYSGDDGGYFIKLYTQSYYVFILIASVVGVYSLFRRPKKEMLIPSLFVLFVTIICIFYSPSSSVNIFGTIMLVLLSTAGYSNFLFRTTEATNALKTAIPIPTKTVYGKPVANNGDVLFKDRSASMAKEQKVEGAEELFPDAVVIEISDISVEKEPEPETVFSKTVIPVTSEAVPMSEPEPKEDLAKNVNEADSDSVPSERSETVIEYEKQIRDIPIVDLLEMRKKKKEKGTTIFNFNFDLDIPDFQQADSIKRSVLLEYMDKDEEVEDVEIKKTEDSSFIPDIQKAEADNSMDELTSLLNKLYKQ
ncbi:MAG: hypothetical protein LBI03_08730 [Clostridiales bacterium]|jgi:hypothetical protein|nr:hypothetical protein [Clostridiales bacterium]